MIGYRKAAVLLHGLHEDDRQWMLDKLSGEERHILTQYLDEIRELGFPSENSVSRESIRRAGKAANASPIEIVAEADAEAVYDVLHTEPVPLTAKLLRTHQWKWTSGVLERFQEPVRGQIRKLIDDDMEISSMLSAHLVKELSIRLEASSHKTSVIAGEHGNSKWKWPQLSTRIKRALWSR